jgi:hypothetical protein
MNNSITMYSLNTGYGSMLLNEVKRLAAITGTPLNYNSGGTTDEQNSGLNMLRDMLSGTSASALKIYTLGQGPSVSVVIMTAQAYALIKRPDVRLLDVTTIKEVIENVSLANLQDLSNAASREGLRSVYPNKDMVELATAMDVWVKQTSSDPAFNFGVGFVLMRMNPGVLLTLAGISGHLKYYNKTWAVYNHNAWEEYRMLAHEDRSARELYNQISGPIALIGLGE